MKIATYNAASVRARMPRLLEWIDENEPDILCIQETKVEDDKFPRDEFEQRGYHLALHGQKAWNGVAIVSVEPPEDVVSGFMDDLFPTDARIISASIAGLRVINTYVPNGNTVGSDKWTYKMRWLDRFAHLLRERHTPDEPLVWLGDINIAPKPIDVFDSAKVLGGVGHHPDEFVRLDRILEFGLTDAFRHLHPDAKEFSYWDFVQPRAVARGIGWRIDHIYLTEPLVGCLSSCRIDLEARQREKPSDHTFVIAELDW
jgi:exodeoxyribonuclease-3